jgi:hypothetical protein
MRIGRNGKKWLKARKILKGHICYQRMKRRINRSGIINLLMVFPGISSLTSRDR